MRNNISVEYVSTITAAKWFDSEGIALPVFCGEAVGGKQLLWGMSAVQTLSLS